MTVDKKLRNLVLSKRAGGYSSADIARTFRMDEEEVQNALLDAGVKIKDVDEKKSFEFRIGHMEEKVADTQTRLLKMRDQRDRLNKRVYQLEAEFKRRGIPLP